MSNGAAEDGRRARRERSRAAIIAALFDLLQEGKIPPDVNDVAERAGVSVSSIFRAFDGLADLQTHALAHANQLFADRFAVDDADQALEDRIRSHVRHRIEFYASAGALLRLARARSVDHEPMVEGLARLRSRFADQTRRRFALEVGQLTPAAAADLVALIDSITSPEAFEVMAASHARTPRQISRAWVDALGAFLVRSTNSESAGETP